MKNAIILHGTGCTPNSYWLPSIKKFLEGRGYSVWTPQLPDTDHPDIKAWLPVVMEHGQFTDETVLIGHSAGGPLVLSILEHVPVVIHKVIVVAGYARPKGKKREVEAILQDSYNWPLIKEHIRDLIFINSNNDPWGCDHHEGIYMWERAGGTLILREGEGHMGSDSFHQPYTRFSLLEKLLEEKYSREVIDGSDKK